MVDVKIVTTPLAETDADTVLVYVFESETDFSDATAAIDDALDGVVKDLITTGEFTGKADQTMVLYPRGSLAAKRVIAVGLGERASFNAEVLRRAGAHGIKQAQAARAFRVASVLVTMDNLSSFEMARHTTEGMVLALYRYHGQKSSEKPEETITTIEFHTTAEDENAVSEGSRRGLTFAAGTRLTRDLVNLPPNICTPSYLAERAEEMARSAGLKCEVLGRQQISTLKMGALLGVAQGSDTPPRFIILEHNADKADDMETIVLVGKGVTFDTGGYSLKPKDGMIGMKADMGGGAAVIGAMGIIAGLNLPLHVVGLVPASDNMVSSKAYRPQEVLTASNGKTIEIISTDAEGRLLLADALVYARRYEPAAVVDIATLTGSCVVALGHAAGGLFGTDETLKATVIRAGAATHERVWSMPIYNEYVKALESDTADTKNSGGRPGGAGVAAAFLRQFVDYPAWAHIDMAGMVTDAKDTPYIPAKGATGYGARLLAQFVYEWAITHDKMERWS
jgi:leucyl aminopeptidase